MRGRSDSRVLGLLLLLAGAAAAGATPPEAARRIVSTAPGITETLYALGLGERVAGVSTFCHFPAEAAAKPKIGTYLQPNTEAIRRLRPDLVIYEKLPRPALDQLAAAGIRAAQIATGNLAVNLKMMSDIAAAAGVPERGAELRARVEAEIAAVRKEAAAQRSGGSAGPARPGVLFLVGRAPGRLDGLVAVGRESYLNELIEAAGGRNVLGGTAVSYPKISLETVLRLRPAVIIDMGDMAETVGVTEERKRAVEALWAARRDLRARVWAVASDVFVVPGPRMGEAAREFLRLIHGAAGRP